MNHRDSARDLGRVLRKALQGKPEEFKRSYLRGYIQVLANSAPEVAKHKEAIYEAAGVQP